MTCFLDSLRCGVSRIAARHLPTTGLLALLVGLAPPASGCGECAAACVSGVQLNVALPAGFDPEAAFSGTACVGTTCGDFTFPAGSISRPPCAEPDSVTQVDLVCFGGAQRDGGYAYFLNYTFHGAVSAGDPAYFKLTDASGSQVFVEHAVTLAPTRHEICGHSCRQQTIDL